MLRVLIVEDEPLLAATLKHLIELNPFHQVTAVADDLPSALGAAQARKPDLALVDLQLARGSTGFSVAVKLGELGIPCLFTTSNAPAFAMPELALGCLSKPFSEEDLARTLRTAEDIIRGRERWRRRNPETLQLYCDVPKPAVIEQVSAAFAPPRSRTRSRKFGLWAAIR